jgi:hypothetical protein
MSATFRLLEIRVYHAELYTFKIMCNISYFMYFCLYNKIMMLLKVMVTQFADRALLAPIACSADLPTVIFVLTVMSFMGNL